MYKKSVVKSFLKKKKKESLVIHVRKFYVQKCPLTGQHTG